MSNGNGIMASFADELESMIYSTRISSLTEANGFRWVAVDELLEIIRTHQPVLSEERREVLTEQVAIAISAWRWDQKTDEPWDSINEPVKEAYRDQAKAALSVVLKELCGEG